MKKLLLLCTALSLVFVACEKSEEDKTPIDASKTKMLMNGVWQMTAHVVIPDVEKPENPPVDAYESFPRCIRDNYMVFTTTSDVVIYEGEEKCTEAAPDSVAYFYSISGDEKHFRMWLIQEDPDNSMVYDSEISYPSTRQFVLKHNAYDPQNKVTSSHTITYERIDVEKFD